MDDDIDFLRYGAQRLTQRFIELEAATVIGADKYERTPERSNSRNGYRDRPWEMRVDNLDLRIAELREGSLFPSFLEPRKTREKPILSVVQEAYVHGVSTRKVDDLVRVLGLDGIDKREVSRIAEELDEEVNLFCNRALEELKNATKKALLGASWQRCTVHFMRNALIHVPRGAQQMVAAYIRTTFAQSDQATTKTNCGKL